MAGPKTPKTTTPMAPPTLGHAKNARVFRLGGGREAPTPPALEDLARLASSLSTFVAGEAHFAALADMTATGKGTGLNVQRGSLVDAAEETLPAPVALATATRPPSPATLATSTTSKATIGKRRGRSKKS